MTIVQGEELCSQCRRGFVPKTGMIEDEVGLCLRACIAVVDDGGLEGSRHICRGRRLHDVNHLLEWGDVQSGDHMVKARPVAGDLFNAKLHLYLGEPEFHVQIVKWQELDGRHAGLQDDLPDLVVL